MLNPTDINIYRQLAGGVTTINVLHGSANTIGGQNAVVKLKYGRDVDEMLFPGAMPGIKFALGENVTQKNAQTAAQAQGRPLRYPATRMGQEEVLRDAFTRARDYKAVVGRLQREGEGATRRRSRPRATSSSSRSSKCSRASASSTRTRIAPTRC